jgi:sialidase-1
MPHCIRLAIPGVIAAGSLGLAVFAHADTLVETTVFDRGEGGYYGFRIPAIVQAQDGSILAFAEARKNSLSDTGDIDMVAKRSVDGGLTWGPIQVISNPGTGKAGNPAPVVDQNTGNIILPFVHNGQNPQVSISTDQGLTWSAPVDITAQAKLPTWSGYHFGPNHAIQLQRGPNAGRLVIPENGNFAGQSLEPAGRHVHLIYSDDGGATWNIGGELLNPTAGIGPNESSVTELVDGTLYVNARNQGTFSRHRLIGYSEDGGLSFTGQAEFEYDLIDPQVQASVVRYSAVDMGDARNRLLFANPKTQDSRTLLYVRSSFDESQSWDEGKLINRGRSAYSDLVTLNDGRAGVLYEWGDTANYEEIRFAVFTERWLDTPTALHYNFDPANLNTTGTPRVASVDGYNYQGQADTYMTMVPGSPDYAGDGAIRFSTLTAGDTVRVYEAADSVNLEFAHEDSFTIEAVFRTMQHGSGTGIIFDKSEAGDSSGEYTLGIANGKLSFHIRDLVGNQANILSSTDVNDGEWHHIAAVRDVAAQKLYLYIDHLLAATVIDLTTQDFGGTVLSQAEVPVLGSSASGSNQFGGDLQHLRISMAALTPDLFLQKIITSLPGDLDGDGFVGISDLNIVLGNWNTNVAAGDPLLGDPSGDGFVGIEDLNVVLGNWNNGTPPNEISTNIPEPRTAVVMLFLAALMGVAPRRTLMPTI